MSELINIGLDFLCGSVAGCAQILVGQPLDFIKTRYQLSTAQPHSLQQIVKSIFTDYGALGFYRGASSIFLGQALISAVEFGVYENAKKMQMGKYEATNLLPEQVLNIKQIGLAGGAVGFFVSFIYCPVEYAKIVRQSNPDLKIGSLRLLLAEIIGGNLKTVYKGLTPTFIRQFFGSAIYYGTYQYSVRTLCRLRGIKRPYANFSDYLLSGSLAGLAFWTIFYPVDVIKTKMQAGQKMGNMMRELVVNGYKGFGVMAMRAILVNAFNFATFEEAKALGKIFKEVIEL